MVDVKPKQVKLQQGKPIPVHSPKVRLFMGPALENARKNRASTISDNMDYSKENALVSVPGKPRCSDSRGGAIIAKHLQTQMDKVLNPSLEAYTEPAAPLRCPMQESRENMMRSRGTLVLVGSGPVRTVPNEVHTRCPGPQAMDNQEKGRGRGMSTIMMHTGDYTSPRRVSKQRPQGTDQQGEMGGCLDQSKKFTAAPPASRCSDPRAREQLERGRGCMDRLMDGSLPVDSQPNPRVRPEAQKNAGVEGRGLRDTMQGGPELDPQPAPRVRSEASGNFNKNRGVLTSEQYSYNSKPDDAPRPGPRLRSEAATSIAASAQGNITRNLFQKYGTLPGDSKPKPHVQPRARGIAKMSRGGAMKDMLNPSKPKKKRRAKSAHY